MKKLIVLSALAVALFCVTPVSASIEDAENAFADLNGNGGTIQVSEVEPYEGMKNLQITITKDSGSDLEFTSNVSGKIKEIANADWFDYNYVFTDLFIKDDAGLPWESAIYDFTNDEENIVVWGGPYSTVRISDGTKTATTSDLESIATDNETETSETVSTGEETVGQKNALSQAQRYLSMMAFSYSGLIQQLEFEQYSTEDATYAADNCGADWNEQAKKKAESYMDLMSFSRDSLIQQLEFEGFTAEQAEYAATAVGY